MSRENITIEKGRQTAGAVSTRKLGGVRLAFFLTGLVGVMFGVMQSPERAWCHVTDVMPDAVAEMEYQILLDFQPEKVDVRNKLAMVLYRKKKFKEAEDELRTVLSVDPANFNALDGLGLVMSQTGRPDEAVKQHLAAIEANPQDVMVHYHLGQAYGLLGDLTAAKKAFRHALELANKPSATVTPAADLDAIRKALEQNEQQLGKTSTPHK